MTANLSMKQFLMGEVFRSKVKPTNDYSKLENKPRIHGVILDGDISLEDLGISAISDDAIDRIFDETEGA